MKPVAMTIENATQYSGLGRTKLYELIRQGKFTPRKSGARTLLLTEELDNYVLSLPTTKRAA